MCVMYDFQSDLSGSHVGLSRNVDYDSDKCFFFSNQVKSSQDKSGQVGSGQVRSGQVKSTQAKIKSNQIRSTRVESLYQ